MKPLKNILAPLLVILMHNLCFAQYKVIDKTSKAPVPYAYVKLSKQNKVLLSDFKGEFNLDSTLALSDSLKITCIGFEDKFVSVAAIKKNSIIELAPSTKQLDEVTVTAKKEKYLTKKLGVTKKPRHNSGFTRITTRNGDERATWIPNNYSAPGRLKSVNVFITDKGFPDAHFRVHVYECDLFQTKPGKELTQSNIIACGTTGNEWVNINLESEHIYISENGCFIGIEWFDSPKSLLYYDTIQYGIIRYKNGKSYENTHTYIETRNGTVLGSVPEVYKYSRHKNWLKTPNSGKWLQFPTDESKFNTNDTLDSGFVINTNENNLYLSIPCINIEVSFRKDKLKHEYDMPRAYKLNRIERVKENRFKYPQGNVSELFASLIKAFENDDIVYVLKYLCVYKEGELKEILEDFTETAEQAGELLTQQQKAEVIENLKEFYSNLPYSKLTKVVPHHFNLSINNVNFDLVVEKGVWKISPYSHGSLRFNH
ncbi:MAG: carboxypeptidase-like regulatory domain-containing protein [Bacteroidia bacterium]